LDWRGDIQLCAQFVNNAPHRGQLGKVGYHRQQDTALAGCLNATISAKPMFPLVEQRGIEPLTSAVRLLRSPN
jgi:hypothetical protein